MSNQLLQWLEEECLTSYGSGWRKDVVNQCLQFGPHQVWHPVTGQGKDFAPLSGMESLWTTRTRGTQ